MNWKDLEGNGRRVVEVLCSHLLEGTMEPHEKT
jgi:hypothetical protein